MTTLLISLFPRHSHNILMGVKTIELRKQSPRHNEEGFRFQRVLIYETSPTKAIVGCFTPGRLLIKNPSLWSSYTEDLRLTSKEIQDYLNNKEGYGIEIIDPKRINNIPLSTMKSVSIFPPQGYRYLEDDDLIKLGIGF